MTNAMAETWARKQHKKLNHASVTDEELSESIVRQAAVTSELVAHMYNNGAGGVGAPPCAIPLVANVWTLTANVGNLTADVATLTANVATLTADVATLTANVATLTSDVATLTTNVATMDARQRCERAQRRNHRNYGVGGNHPFTQLVKCNANVGPPLPGQAAQNPPWLPWAQSILLLGPLGLRRILPTR